jgi:hypothetical protein
MDENIQYLQGVIPFTKFMDRVDQNKQEAKNNVQVNYDKRFLNLVSKYFRVLHGRLSKIKYDTTCTPVNPLARQHMEEFKNKLAIAYQMKQLAEQRQIPILNEILTEVGMEDLPEDDIELQIKMNESLPMQAAMNMELYLKWITHIDDFDVKIDEAAYYMIACGCAAFEEVLDANGNPSSEAVDPRTLLVGWSNKDDLRDVNEIGKFRMITISDIMKEDVNGDLEGQYGEIQKYFAGKYGNSSFFPDQNVRGFRNIDTVYAKNRVLVLDLYFYSYDDKVYVAKNNKHGNRRVVAKDFSYYQGKEEEFKKNHPDKEIYRTRTKNIYKCSWIVGSDFMYNFGLYRNSARTKRDPKDTRLPILVIAPFIRNGKIPSIIEELKPIADSANLKWKKMQEAVAHARPPGFQFDVDSLYEAVKAMKNDGYNFERVMEMMLDHNIIPVSSKGIGGYQNGQRPFEERYGGLGPDFKGWVDGLMTDLMLMQEITGVSSVAAGTDVQYTGKQVANMAVETAADATRHLFTGMKKLYQNSMQMKILLGMDSIAEGKAYGIRIGLGGAYEFFQINPEFSLYDYSIMVEFMPNEKDWMDLQGEINIAMQTPIESGGITLQDSLRIKECQSIKQARMYLYVAIKRNMKQAQKRQMEMLQMKSQQDQQTAAIAQQARIEALKMELEMEQQKAQIQLQLQSTINGQKFQYDLELAKLNGLIQTDQINTQGEIDKAVTEIKARYNMDRMKTNTLQVGQ